MNFTPIESTYLDLFLVIFVSWFVSLWFVSLVSVGFLAFLLGMLKAFLLRMLKTSIIYENPAESESKSDSHFEARIHSQILIHVAYKNLSFLYLRGDVFEQKMNISLKT